nr:NAD(P)-dependent oxidoreductase [Duganella lactea]
MIGGSGLIGTALSESLLAEGHRVRVLDLVAPQQHLAAAVEWIYCDVRDRAQLEALAPCDTVYLLAALLGKGCAENPENGWKTNVLGQVNAIDAIRQLSSPPAVCFLSSASVYRAADKSGPISESAPLQPRSLYAASKMMGEDLLRAAGSAFGLRSYVLRPFTVYGPGPGSARKGHFVSTWMERALAGEPLVVHGEGRQTVDLAHVSDLAVLCRLAAQAAIASTDVPVLNVGGGMATSLLDVLAWIREYVPEVRCRFDASVKPVEHRHWADIGAAQRMIGYVPKVHPRDGVAALIKNQLARRS